MFRCPNAKAHATNATFRSGHHHDTKAQVILCAHRGEVGLDSLEEAEYEAYMDDCEEAQCRAEYEAELRNERFWEERGAEDCPDWAR